MSKNVLIGYFEVPGYGADSVETPLEGTPKQQYAALEALVSKRHPKVPIGSITRTGSKIVSRDEANAFVEFAPGSTIAQLFTPETPSRKVGRVFFSNEPMEIVLNYNRGAGHVSVQLRSVLSSGGIANFTSKIQPQRLATELELALKEALGENGIRQMELNLRAQSPKGRKI